jgi:hypothetical protein
LDPSDPLVIREADVLGAVGSSASTVPECTETQTRMIDVVSSDATANVTPIKKAQAVSSLSKSQILSSSSPHSGKLFSLSCMKIVSPCLADFFLS